MSINSFASWAPYTNRSCPDAVNVVMQKTLVDWLCWTWSILYSSKNSMDFVLNPYLQTANTQKCVAKSKSFVSFPIKVLALDLQWNIVWKYAEKRRAMVKSNGRANTRDTAMWACGTEHKTGFSEMLQTSASAPLTYLIKLFDPSINQI